MRVHVVSLPHTEVVRDWSTCAYTEKVRKWCDMLAGLGHEPILYAGERNESKAELVTIVTEHDRRRWWGAETYAEKVFDGFHANGFWWVEMNARAAHEIRRRSEPGDLLGVIAGDCQQQLVDSLPELTAIEWGVGYQGVITRKRVFESQAWQHHVYGLRGEVDGNPDDCVIPNFFDPADFTYSPKKDDYLLFLGRHIDRKGLDVVRAVAEQHRVVTAGQGGPLDGIEYAGIVRGKERADLLANARGLLAPTTYIEPFGGVAVEAMISGTPVLASDWGAFTETVVPDAGIRCRTIPDFLAAVDQLEQLDPRKVRKHGLRYSCDAIAPLYDSYLRRF